MWWGGGEDGRAKSLHNYVFLEILYIFMFRVFIILPTPTCIKIPSGKKEHRDNEQSFRFS
jgi:hypothetical protein